MASAVAVNTFVLDAMPNRVWASTGVGLTQPPHAVALGEHDLAVLHDRDGDAGHLERLEHLGDVGVESRRRPGGFLGGGRDGPE